MGKELAQGNNRSLWWDSNSRPTGIHWLRVKHTTYCALPTLRPFDRSWIAGSGVNVLLKITHTELKILVLNFLPYFQRKQDYEHRQREADLPMSLPMAVPKTKPTNDNQSDDKEKPKSTKSQKVWNNYELHVITVDWKMFVNDFATGIKRAISVDTSLVIWYMVVMRGLFCNMSTLKTGHGGQVTIIPSYII